MIIRKFTAPTMTEALAKVREELGENAVILGTRSDKQGGVFDFLGRRVVEVTAAVDERPVRGNGTGGTRPAPVTPSEARLYPPERPVAYAPPRKPPTAVRHDRMEIAESVNRLDVERLSRDMDDLKRSLKVLADASLAGDMAGLPGNLASLLQTITRAGLDDKIAKRLVRQLLDELTGSDLSSGRVVRDRATALLAAGMPESQPLAVKPGAHRTVAFVGPTGSGKTTTIAKLAADFILNRSHRIAVLTVDTRRVDAVGQLKAYCRILNVPLHIAYTPDDLADILPDLEKSDLTLVDTPGAGPMDREHLREMIEFLQRMSPQEVHLVMAVTTSREEMERIGANFAMMKPNRLLFTKLDETDRYGPLVSFAIGAKKPLLYITTGQSVPGDFEAADTSRLARMVIEPDEFVE